MRSDQFLAQKLQPITLHVPHSFCDGIELLCSVPEKLVPDWPTRVQVSGACVAGIRVQGSDCVNNSR